MLSLIAVALGVSVGYGIDKEEYSKNAKSVPISSGLTQDLEGGLKGIEKIGSQIETDVKHGATYVYHALTSAKKDISTDVHTASNDITKVLPGDVFHALTSAKKDISTDVHTASNDITKVLPKDVYHAIHSIPVVQDVSNDVHTASKDVYHSVQSVTKDFSHIFHW